MRSGATFASCRQSFAADGTAAARDEDRLAGYVPRSNARVEHDFLAPQQVGDLHVAQGNALEFVHTQFAYVRQRLEAAVGLGTDGIDALSLLRRGRRNGDDDLLDVETFDQRDDVVARTRHLHPMDAQALFRRIVVRGDDGNARHVGVLRRHAVDGEGTGLASSYHERPRPFDRRSRESMFLAALDAPYHADPPHDEHQQDGRDDKHPDGESHVDDPQEHGAYERRQKNREHDLERLVDAGIFPQVVVQVEGCENPHVDQCQDAEHEVDLVVDEHETPNVGQHRCQPIRHIGGDDVKQKQKRRSFRYA